MAVVTLTTDWGADGAYSGAFRGLMFSLAPDMAVIDISNSIPPFDIGKASFVLSQAFSYFPAGTVHIVGVAPVQNDKSMHRYVAIESNGHFFIGANSGVWELLLGESDFQLHELALQPKTFGGTGFPELEIFARATAGIFKHQSIAFLGKQLPAGALARQMPLMPKIKADEIIGHVAVFDVYGNAITDISHQDMAEIGKERPFEITVSSARHKIYRINQSYNDSLQGQMLAIYSFSGFLEIAQANGNVRELLSLNIGDAIIVKFKEMPAQGSLF